MYKFNSFFFLLFILAFFIIETPSYAIQQNHQVTSVIIDTDMAFDDWGAILYLLNNKDVQVKGITVSGTGEAHCDRASGNLAGAVNALRLIDLAGKQNFNIPVACGQSIPTQGHHVFPTSWRTHVDTLAGIFLPQSKSKPFSGDAAELIISLLEKSREKIKIVELGPLTNLGVVLQKRPDLISHIDSIIIMGGAVHVPGNLKDPTSPISNNQFAEWNIYVDPHAAQLVFKCGAPIKLISLDGTNHAPVTLNFIKQLKEHQHTASAQFFFNVLTRQSDFIKIGKAYFWDKLAATILTHPSLCEFKLEPLLVTEGEGPESGRTYVDKVHGYPVYVCTKAQGDKFQGLFLRTINNVA